MDDQGLGAALKVAFRMFEISSRRTGRSERLLASALPGDRIIVATGPERRRLLSRLRELGKDGVEVRVAETSSSAERMGRNRSGATLFDHGWVERFFEKRIDSARSELDALQEILSSPPDRATDPGPDLDPRRQYNPWRDAELRG